MLFQPTKYDKSRVRVSDFIVSYCDHRGSCVQKCEVNSTACLKKADIAYRELRHCSRFKPYKGVVEGVEIMETGIWKYS